jgi:sugar phosphate permease
MSVSTPAVDQHGLDKPSYSSRWTRLAPIVFITYSLAYVDRANYSIGSAGGLSGDLGITGQAGALLGALFFLGYFLFQIPAAWYAETRSAKRLMFWSLLAWGVLAAATGAITDINLLYVDRFLLGVAESVVLPAMLIFLSHWFSSAERSRTNTILILGNPVTVLWMSIVSAYLVNAIGWRGMFIAEGRRSFGRSSLSGWYRMSPPKRPGSTHTNGPISNSGCARNSNG